MSDDTEDGEGGEGDNNIIRLRPGAPGKERTYEKTLIDNSRRYPVNKCPHKGPFVVDDKLGTVECGDCGALLNPVYVLVALAAQETYWNQRQKDLSEYLAEINRELEGRSRTKCTHCGNMTAIRFKGKSPRTWVPQPY